jgi:hypothetical protein
MTEEELLSLCRAEVDRSADYIQTEIASQRAKAYDYYWGKPFGNEIEGRSSLVTRDVQQHVDSVLPGLVKTFVGSDSAVEFKPRGAEDVAKAEEQTDLANYVYQTWNTGYQLTHDCLKNGLLQKTGVFKWWWEPETKVSEETIYGLDDAQMQQMGQEPDCEIIAHSEYQIAILGQPTTLHDITVRKKKESGKVKIAVLPCEEFLISPKATSQYAEEAPMIGHVTNKTYSELVEMGIDRAILDEVGGSSEDSNVDQEKNSRQDRTGAFGSQDKDENDPARRMYRYYELYPLVDFDGDGVTERRRVCLINKTKIVHNEVTDHVPLAWWSPKIMPGEPIGMSVADDLMDLQFTRSTFRRQAADNLYVSNNPRLYVNEDADVNIEDVLTVRPNGIIRGRGPANNALFPIVVPFVAQHVFQMDEQLAQEGELRTGISRFVQGTDPNSINKTATHASIVNQATQMRTEMYARNFAEFAFIPLFRGVKYLLAKHQTTALTARLRGKVAEIAPDVWNAEYDMSCNVGLGTGNKDQQLMHLQGLAQDVAMVMQSPFAKVLLDPGKAYNLFEKKCELAGFKDATQFMNNPADMDPQQVQQMMQPPPDPNQQKLEMEKQKAEQAAQIEQQKLGQQQQADQQKAQSEAQIASQKQQADLSLQQQKGQQEMALKERELQMEFVLEKMKLMMEVQLEKMKTELMAGVQERVGMAQAANQPRQE